MADQELHICEKAERIATLEANTEQQGTDIAEIKKDLKALNNKVDENHKAMNNELKLIRDDVGAIKTAVVAQSTKIDALTKTVEKSVSSIDTLHEKVEGLDKTVTLHTKDISDLKDSTDDHGKRLNRVEKKVWKIVAIIGAAIFILQLISTMSSCSDIKHFIKQAFVEEQQQIEQYQAAQNQEQHP